MKKRPGRKAPTKQKKAARIRRPAQGTETVSGYFEAADALTGATLAENIGHALARAALLALLLKDERVAQLFERLRPAVERDLSRAVESALNGTTPEDLTARLATAVLAALRPHEAAIASAIGTFVQGLAAQVDQRATPAIGFLVFSELVEEFLRVNVNGESDEPEPWVVEPYSPPPPRVKLPSLNLALDEVLALVAPALKELATAEAETLRTPTGKLPRHAERKIPEWTRWLYDAHVRVPRRPIRELAREYHEAQHPTATFAVCGSGDRQEIRKRIKQVVRLLSYGGTPLATMGGVVTAKRHT